MAIDGVRLVTWPLLLMPFLLIVLLGFMFGSEVHGQSTLAETMVYGKVVEHDSGQDVRVPNAGISFIGSNGASKTVATDGNGEYSIKLSSGDNYSMTVTSRGFCPAHRPPFAAGPGRKAKFDIVLTTACPKDVVVASGGADSDVETEFCARAGIYYCEQQLTLDGRTPVTMVIGFASRRIEERDIFYGSDMKRPQSAHGQSANLDRTSVLVAFGTFTIHAKNVILNLQKEILTAQGNVSITHDDREVALGSPCMSIHFGKKEPAVHSCD